MRNVIEDIAAEKAVAWGTIAKKIDENFDNLADKCEQAVDSIEEDVEALNGVVVELSAVNTWNDVE